MSPDHPLVAWYGDDMTGSIDVLEAVTRAGVRGVLVVDPPDVAHLERYADALAIGWAGSTRTLDPDAIAATVTDAARVLAASGAPLLHYKICSTFDSSPAVGSIGAAIDAAQAVLDSPFVAVLPAAPELNRWCAFSNLFARSGPESPVFRLDRHPTMRAHPSTPMRESDLRTILAEQTSRPIGDVDLTHLQGGRPAVEERLDALVAEGVDTIVLDAVEPDHARLLAEVLWDRARTTPLLAVASSGLEHGLRSVWSTPGATAVAQERDAQDVVLAVCGSRSPVTDAQIAHAVGHGWVEVPLELSVATRPEALQRVVTDAAAQARAALEDGRSVVVHTAGRPVADGASAVRIGSLDADGRRRLGAALGAVAAAVLAQTPVRRLAVAGGDSSGAALREMGVEALEVAAPFAPAMPFCRLHADGRYTGVEVVCKGGQTGTRSFFDDVRRGRPTPVDRVEVAA